MTQSPSVPAPSTTTRSPPAILVAQAACTPQAAGSTITAASSERSSGTCEAGSRARRALPTTRRRCRGSSPSEGRVAGGRRRSARRSPCARWHSRGIAVRCPAPRSRAPARLRPCGHRAGPPSTSPTISWPGTKGKLTMLLEIAGAPAVQRREVRAADPGEPRPHPHPVRARDAGGRRPRPARAGRREHPFRNRRRPRRPVPPRSGAGCARTGAPSSTALRPWKSSANPTPSTARPGGCVGTASGAPRTAGRPLPVLDRPSPPAGDRRQLRLGVHSDREARRLEHGQVARRVRVGDGVAECQAVAHGRISIEEQRARLAGRRRRVSISPVNLPSRSPMLGADDLVEQRPSGSTTKSSAPVMSSVLWPSARWLRTRAIASGKARGARRSLNSSQPSRRS